jgi:hypothetical protein
MVAANTEDPVTMEVPKQCVTLYDWDARKKYIFEAATIYRDILEKLFYCSGLFPSSMHPRNPYTNENMTIGQDIHCVQQLHAFGFRSWAIEAYRAAQFNLDSFMAMHARAIKGEALYRAFKHKTTEYEELLFDFIEDEYERHSVDIPVYKELSWAICEAPNLRILQQWSELCYTYYRDLFRSPDEQSAEILKKMKARSALLVEASLQPILEEYKKRGPKPLTTTPVQQETFTFNFDELVSLLTEL